MVFYFTPRGATKENGMLIYMGKDKYENEELIRYAFDEDVWFHVDNLSSAHVYLRLPRGMSIDDIPEDTLEDCCQLVKENSIQGCKQDNVPIIYTPWKNLRKQKSMEVGQVGYHSQKEVRKTTVAKKDKIILKRLEKTREERHNDARELAEERERYDKLLKGERKALAKKLEDERKVAAAESRAQKELREYKTILAEDALEEHKAEMEKYKGNFNAYEDDFM
ncbi:unnamed protein product [Pedinophyceae sp. YPF-701]|nr:unnamed protein product [Pedinophyceae sp. YPF-701]